MNDIPVIDYLSIGEQNTITGKSSSYMSRIEWQCYFCDNNFSVIDPVRQSMFYNVSTFIAFDELDFINSAGSEVMRQRKKHYIMNGFSLIKRELDKNYVITLGTGYKKFSARQFYLKNHNRVNTFFLNTTKHLL